MDKSQIQCEEYKNILMSEYEQAQKDVRDATSTFHFGLRDALLREGYIVTSAHDNSIYFYGKSRLFEYYAHQDYHGRVGSPWILTEKIRLHFANYSWDEIYQYPNYKRKVNYITINIKEFTRYYLSTCEDIVSILQAFKTGKDNIEKFKSFSVFANGDGGRLVLAGEFDNYEDARKYAYDKAMEECKKGRNRRDCSSPYYHLSPRDVTMNYPDKCVMYEYYNYSEHSFYYYVVGE